MQMPLVLHPDAFLQARHDVPDRQLEPSAYLSRQGLLDAGLALTETEQPSLVLDGMVLVTGQVERTNDIETGWPAHYAERDGDMGPIRSSVTIRRLSSTCAARGWWSFSGCGHAGIVNMAAYARALTGVQRSCRHGRLPPWPEAVSRPH